jgi:uncharacterized membrane protein YhaH (DUF805 family)
MTFENTFVNPKGRTSRAAFIPAVIIVLAVAAFYHFVAKAGRNGEWVLLTLLFPALMLHARRLHDMGQTAWLLLAPAALIVAAAWMHMFGQDGQVQSYLAVAAIVVSAGFVVWGAVGKGQAEVNRFGEPAAA